jgi:hypothetical protein
MKRRGGPAHNARDRRSWRGAERATMVAHDLLVLADHNVVSIGVDFGRPAARVATEVFIVIEAHQAGLRDGGRDVVESAEAAGIGNELWRSASKTSQIVWPASSG